MSRVYAECNIVLNSTLAAKSIRKRTAQVNMDIFTSQGVGPVQGEPITLVIKGADLSHVWELMSTYHKSDTELAEKVRGSVLADEVKGMTDEEIGDWARGNILDELKEMQGGADEDPLV